MDKYTKKYIRLIKQAKSDQELSDLIDTIYTDGFDDGEQSAGTYQDKLKQILEQITGKGGNL